MESPQKRIPDVYLVDVRSARSKEKLAEEIVSTYDAIPVYRNSPQIVPIDSVVITELPRVDLGSPPTPPVQESGKYKQINLDDKRRIIKMSQEVYSRNIKMFINNLLICQQNY